MWSHKKFGKAKFKGEYDHIRGNRIFILVCVGKKNQEFQSWQAAKKAGWIKA